MVRMIVLANCELVRANIVSGENPEVEARIRVFIGLRKHLA